MVTDPVKEIKWRCSFVYGEPVPTSATTCGLSLIERIIPSSDVPWFVAGDFNEAMWQDELFSSRRRNEKQMLDFREILSHCNLFDLGYSGTSWTYDNKRAGADNVPVRLDRAVTSPSWST